jgi:hypothetical protein
VLVQQLQALQQLQLLCVLQQVKGGSGAAPAAAGHHLALSLMLQLLVAWAGWAAGEAWIQVAECLQSCDNPLQVGGRQPHKEYAM